MTLSRAHLWEWSATLEEGVALSNGAPWRGHLIRYREQGTRRYRSFILSLDGDTSPTVTQVLAAIEAHAAQVPV